MKIFLLMVAVVSAGFAGCEKQASTDAEAARQQVQREADERRIAELRDLEQRAADRKAEEEAAEWQRQRDDLAAERAKLERERAQLADAQDRAATDARLAKIREEERRFAEREAQRNADQRRLAEERAAEDADRRRRDAQTVDFFYDALEPHGDWVEVERYGYCWQPRSASNSRWRPYLAGNWARTDYGWTWVSREPFGWATYHYGRWIRLRRMGWVWVPGSEWAPAWVSWRRGDRYVGWAPLPPEARSSRGFTAAVDRDYDIGPAHYNFVPTDALAEDTYEGKALEPERNITVIQQTVNVTNITVRNVQNRTVIYNEGPRLVNQAQANKVRRLQVERIEKLDRQPAPAEQRGSVLQVVAPVIAPRDQKPARPPAKVRERVQSVDVERGWTGTDAGKIAELKEQQKKEARDVEQPPRPSQPPVPSSSPEAKPATTTAKETTRPAGTPSLETPRTPAPSKPPTESTNPVATPKALDPAPPVTPVTPLTPAKPENRPMPKESTPPAVRPAEIPPTDPPRPDRPNRRERAERPDAPGEAPKNEGEKAAPVRERPPGDRTRSEAPAGGLRKLPSPSPAPEVRKPADPASAPTPAPADASRPAPNLTAPPAANAKPGPGEAEPPRASGPVREARPTPRDGKNENDQPARNRDRDRDNRPDRALQPPASLNPATPPPPNAAVAPGLAPAPAIETTPPKAPGPKKAEAGQASPTASDVSEKEDPSNATNRNQRERPARANAAEERRKRE